MIGLFNTNAFSFLTIGPLTLPSPPAYRQAGAGERDRVRGDTNGCNEIYCVWFRKKGHFNEMAWSD
jgi:hypothetical protein